MKIILTVLSTLIAVSSVASLPPQPPCEQRFPQALNVSVPRIAGLTASGGAQVEEQLRRVFSAIYARNHAGPCNGLQPIQLNIAVGNDYQMLEWLNQGVIDAAVVTDLTLSLLKRDQVVVYDIDPNLDGAADLLPVLSMAPQVRRRNVARGWQIAELTPEREFDRLLDEVWASANGNPAPIRHEVLLASHLSSTGFLWPLARAATRFASAPQATRDAAWTRFFAATRFVVDCDSADDCFNSATEGELGERDRHTISDGTIVILFPGEETLRHMTPAAAGAAYRQHFIITASAARRIFGVTQPNAIFGEPRPKTPAVVTSLFKDTPAELQDAFNPQPLFRTRTYAFTVDEALRLVRQQQRSTSDSNLALVLPGGGVKAAYQTRIIDELYRHEYLRNEHATARSNSGAIPVREVIGTSGGALIGYFVAQLGTNPVSLFDVLWKKGNNLMTSTDIFGWTDLLRYVSIVVSYAILCFLLFFHSVGQQRTPGTAVFRWRLSLAVMPLFVLTPVLVRVASDQSAEHIPDIEGIFYAIMAIMVMVADQALIRTPAGVQPPAAAAAPSLKRYNVILAACGIGLLVVALVAKLTHSHMVNFAVAFASMAVLLIGGTIAVAVAKGHFTNPARRCVEITLAVAAVLLLCSFGLMFSIPHILAGLALILVGALQYWYTKAPRYGLQWLITFAAVLLIAELCWPEKPLHISPFGLAFLRTESLQITTAAFFLALGLILVLVAGALWTFRSGRYDIDRPADLAAAMIVLIAYAFVTLAIFIALTLLLPNLVTPLELTMRFWIALAIVSVVVGLVTIAASKRTPLSGAVPYLISDHPNGTILQSRYLRILLLAVFAVAWWNVVEAPALYGNRKAKEYHYGAIARFNRSRHTAKMAFSPTARFVTPANVLKVNGTRYFLFLPIGESGCPEVPERDASGAQWNVYRGAEGSADSGRCQPQPAPLLVADVAFASGSPFPIFPAHTIDERLRNLIPRSDVDDAYVDGGYSNNIPVDAARTLQAKQVLIIDSSSPLPPTPRPATRWQSVRTAVFGKLIVNAERLPGYLFERSQEIDRLSRRDMFVVSLAPSRDEENWPPLFDFRSSTVQQMYEAADRDLSRRIGIVESWGEPSFAFHGELAPVMSASSATP